MKTFKRFGVWAFGGLGDGPSPPRPPAHTGTARLARPILRGLIFTLVASLSAGCAYYSFSGATIPSQLNTVAVPLAVDNTISPVNTLDQDLTDLLTDRFVGQTRLELQTNEQQADAVLTARIQAYENAPTSVSGDERASRNRVTIRVAATYYDQVEDQEMLSQTFSSFGEYDPAQSGLDGERSAAQEALENIADDIFTAATSNW
ncbi:MAG: hypothetical protein GVY12_01810 [Bacteroidetes bacterium]|jgi:hypothetical protein|nr:hypothetical protein [Bacteroidota bacterium]